MVRIVNGQVVDSSSAASAVQKRRVGVSQGPTGSAKICGGFEGLRADANAFFSLLSTLRIAIVVVMVTAVPAHCAHNSIASTRYENPPKPYKSYTSLSIPQPELTPNGQIQSF